MITSTSALISPVLNRLTACFCKSFSVPVPFCIPNFSLIRVYSQQITKMGNKLNWMVEKKRILQLPLEDKRKLYKNPNYMALQKVEAWRLYSIRNKEVVERKYNQDDVQEYQKCKFNPDLDVSLAEKVTIFKGDITTLEVDAIVNAANSALRAGGGVDGAIHRAAGPLLQAECSTLGGCATGQAKITGGYNLPAKYVIHTVGPQDGNAAALQSCYDKCLAFQREYHIKSIAFPCISTGIYGFPNRLAAHIALKTARSFLEKNGEIERIIFCLFMPIDVEIYETLMQMYFPLHACNYNDGASLTE